MFWWLTAHPDVCGSSVKETHFFDDEIYPRFNATANVHEHGLDVYEKYFAQCEGAKVVLEATPIYLYQQTAIKAFADFLPKPKVLFVLREPSQRAHSQFRFNKYRLGNIDLGMSYEQYLKKTEGSANNPLDRGFYINFLQPWINAIGKENMLVVQAESLFCNRVEGMKAIARFLSLDPSFYDGFDYMKRNETRKMRSTGLHRLGLKIQPLVPQWIQEKVLIPLYLKMNSTAMPPVSAKEKEAIQSFKSQFIESNQRLAAEFPNIDLSLWK